MKLKPSAWTGVPLAVLLLLPSLVFVFLDQSVWSWDAASYGEHALRLHLELVRQPAQWWRDLPHLSGPYAPGMEWLGQFSVALRGLTGSVERSLELLTLGIQAASLALLWATVWTLSRGSVLASLTTCLFVAAAPIFVGLSTRFMVESLQGLSVCGFLYSAVRSTRWRRLTTLTAIVVWTSIALLAKVTSPLYCLVPGAVCVWHLFRPREQAPEATTASAQARSGAGLALAILLLLATATWYRANLGPLLDYAKTASSGAVGELYGHRAPFLDKLVEWLRSANRCFSRWEIWLVIPVVAASSSLLGRLRKGATGIERTDDLFSGALMSACQIALGMAVVSLNVNEDPRFIYALLPCFGILAAWMITRIRPHPIAAALAGLLFFQYASVHATAFGIAHGKLPWVDPVVTSSQKKEALAALVASTVDAGSNGRVVFIAVELPWLNHASYRLEARKHFEKTGWMPLIYGFGYTQLDPDDAFRAVLNSNPVSVVSYVDPAEPELKSPFNRNVSSLLARFRTSPRFTERALEGDPRIRIFALSPASRE